MARVGRDDVPTLVAIGALVSIVAALAHELLGHGLGCAADGGTVTLLTYLVFRCQGAGLLADGGGPVAAFALAAAAWLFLARRRDRRSATALFLFALGAQTLLWVFAQMVREAIDGSDDWGHVARDLNWPAWWHPVLAVTGVAGYLLTLRLGTPLARAVAAGRPWRLLHPYWAAALSAVLLGALWQGDRGGSALDAFLSFGLAPLGYLLVIRAVARDAPAAAGGVIGRQPAWIAGAAVLWIGFALTVARGVGRLA